MSFSRCRAARCFSSANDTRWGGSVFVLNRSVDVEYDHLFLNDHNTTFTLAAGTERIHQDVDMTWCV